MIATNVMINKLQRGLLVNNSYLLMIKFQLQNILKPMFSSKSSIKQRHKLTNSMKANSSRQKYIVIDSQTDQTYYCYTTQPQLFTNSKTNTDKYRCDSLYAEKQQLVIDQSILKAQRQVQKIQNECELLQKIISDMIKEQASLIVQQRRQQRGQNIRQLQNKAYKTFSISNKRNTSAHNYIRNSIDKVQILTKDDPMETFTSTPLLSENIQNYPQHIQPLKTKQIISRKKDIENITPKKKHKESCSTKHESCFSSKKKRCTKQTKC